MARLDSAAFCALLGYPGGFPSVDAAFEAAVEEIVAGIKVSRGRVRSGGRDLPAVLLEPPARASGDRPGILYCHAHGGRYDIGKAEVLEGRPALLDPPLGIALAQAGNVVLCVDMPGFGDRQSEGTESQLAKAALWQGRSLLGDMLRDQAIAYRALCGLDGVAPGRTAAVGISMGATLAYAFAALTPEVACAAHMCAFADMAPLIASGAHDLHGVYMVIPGLLRRHDLSDIAALVAPRPQLVCSGLRDPLTPESALLPALSRLEAAYAPIPGAAPLRVITDPESGHEETPAFRAALMAFLAETL